MSLRGRWRGRPQVLDEEDGLFLFPVTEHASEIIAIMRLVMEANLKDEADPAVVLPAADDRANALFEPDGDITARRLTHTARSWST